MSFFADYGLFIAKTATIVIAILIILIAVIAMKAKAKAEQKGRLTIKKVNHTYDDIEETINDVIQSKKEKKALKAKLKKEEKAKKKKKDTDKHRIFLLNFQGDIRASALSALREEITAILLTAKPEDHVLLRLESGGGMVNAYGLAASQLQRLRDANLYLVIAIDKIAASGGYMMACVANDIIAAPFSVIGSIGVIAQLPNFHRLLEKNNVEFEQITAGEYKRTLTMFGKNTKAGREKLQEDINDIHGLFKDFVKSHREQVIIDEVATGEHWFATQAIEKQLVDKLQTSDDYLVSKKDEYDIYEIQYKMKQPLSKRLADSVDNLAHNLFSSHLSAKRDYL